MQKVDLITQVKQLQEKLNHLVYSMNFQNVETEDFNSQQPLAFSHVLENSLNGSSSNGEETDKLPPVDEFTINKMTQDVIDIIGNQDSLIRNEMPSVPMEDKVDLQDGSLCLQVSLPSSSRDLTYTEEAEPLKNALSAMDLSSWSSPEVVRKDSMLELPPSLPLTPCLDVVSQHSLDISLRERTSASMLQADQSGLLCSLGGSAAKKAPCWAESSLAADRAPSADPHVHRMVVVGWLPWVLWVLSCFSVCVVHRAPVCSHGTVSTWPVVSQRQPLLVHLLQASRPGVDELVTVPWSAMYRAS